MEKIKKNMDEILLGKVYYKLRQGVTGTILEIATSLLQIAIGIINCDERYYKLRQVLQIAMLLQIATVKRFSG